jgi:hypothetical protein
MCSQQGKATYVLQRWVSSISLAHVQSAGQGNLCVAAVGIVHQPGSCAVSRARQHLVLHRGIVRQPGSREASRARQQLLLHVLLFISLAQVRPAEQVKWLQCSLPVGC